VTTDATDATGLGPLDPELRRLLRAEAYRVPVRLTRADLDRGVQRSGRLGRWPRWAGLASGVAVAALVAIIGFSALSTGRPPSGASASPDATCDEAAPATVHGSWWSEVGGPHAFFNVEPGTRRATNPGETWLLHVRFDPDAAESLLGLSAVELATGRRIEGTLNGRADPASIYRFDQPAPPLPGGWYLFQQDVPTAGCWRLEASIGDDIVGSAVVVVAEATRPEQWFCDGRVETSPSNGPGAAPTDCLAAVELVRAAHPDAFASAWGAIVQPMCPPGMICDQAAPYLIAVVLLAPPSSSAGWLAYPVVGAAGPERVAGVTVDLPEHILDTIRQHGVRTERPYRLVCGPIAAEPCAERAFGVIRAYEGDDPSPVESVTFLDELGSYTLRLVTGDEVTGIFN
jgi:hypothetical protein